MWGAEDTDQGSKAEKQRWKGQKETETSGKRRVGERQQRTDKMQRKRETEIVKKDRG